MKFQETRLLLFLKAEPKLSASYLILFFFLVSLGEEILSDILKRSVLYCDS